MHLYEFSVKFSVMWLHILGQYTLLTLTLAYSSAAQQPGVLGISLQEALSRSYEYVIVGSGPGGGPLASRLALAGHSVLLIDAGDDQRSNINYRVPAFEARASQDPQMHWDFYIRQYTNDSKARRSNKAVWSTLEGGQYVGSDPPRSATYQGILYPRGSTLGGSAAVNAMVAMAPHDDDWRNIHSMTGDASWSPENMRRYFVKLERNQYLPANASGHGYNGYMGTEMAPVDVILGSKTTSSWLSAAARAVQGIVAGTRRRRCSNVTVNQLNQMLAADPNAPSKQRDQTPALYQVPLWTTKHVRNSPADFIADTIAQGAPLTVLPNTLVTGIVWNDTASNLTAQGVTFLHGKSLYAADPRFDNDTQGVAGSINAAREVIIAGGAFNTPQILKLSGIGPADELRKVGLTVRVDAPGVGANLQDRYENSIVWEAQPEQGASNSSTGNQTSHTTTTTSSPSTDPYLQLWSQQSNGPAGGGPYAGNGLAAGIALKSSVASQSGPFANDIDTFLYGGPVDFHGYYPGWADAAAGSGKPKWSWTVLKAHTRNAAGTVELRSADPRERVDVNFRYFGEGTDDEGVNGNELDRGAAVEGLRFARRVHSLMSQQQNGTARYEEARPGKNADLEEFVKDSSWGHHACCTARIGADGDAGAVLDSKFRVRGVRNLRVVDASVFPDIPGLFLSAPIMMLSEKAADVILADL